MKLKNPGRSSVVGRPTAEFTKIVINEDRSITKFSGQVEPTVDYSLRAACPLDAVDLKVVGRDVAEVILVMRERMSQY